jgi:hypothetical protein
MYNLSGVFYQDCRKWTQKRENRRSSNLKLKFHFIYLTVSQLAILCVVQQHVLLILPLINSWVN